MNLSKTNINQEYIIQMINIDKCTRLRLQVLGVLKGTKVKVLNKRNSGDIILKIRGTRYGVDKEVAESIQCISLESTKEDKNEKSKCSFYRKP